jgi:hypothetical protein
MVIPDLNCSPPEEDNVPPEEDAGTLHMFPVWKWMTFMFQEQ